MTEEIEIEKGPVIEEKSPENSEEYAPEGLEKGEGPDFLKELEELKKEVEKRAKSSDLADLENWKRDVLERMDVLESEIAHLKEEDERLMTKIKEFTDFVVGKNDELMKELESKVDNTRMKLLKKDMLKMNKKLLSVMEETGFGEIIDVTKIPPNILEIVYDTTLKDLSMNLWKEFGPGAENIIIDTLERIRLETSGSEMFYYDGRFIRTRDVAKNIKRGMISAKQLQDTYEALIKALSEHVPSYKPKNFKAMIKLKSQEYTVDKTTSLLERMEMMEERISRIDTMLSSTVSGLSSQAERIAQLENRLKEETEKILMDELSRRDSRLDSLERALNSLREEYSVSLNSVQESLKENAITIEAISKRLDGVESGKSGKAVKGKTGTRETEDSQSLSEEERFVSSAVPSDGISYTKLKKLVLSFISSPLDDILSSLIKKGLIIEDKKGRTRRFFPVTKIDTGEKPVKAGDIAEKDVESSEMAEEMSARILDAIPERGCTINRLKKALAKSMKGEDVENIVNMLVEEGRLDKTTRGRYTIYVKKEEKGGEKDA